MIKPGFFFIFILGLLILTCTQVFAQTSNKGTNFWLGYGNHVSHGSNNPETMVLYITSDVSTSATVSVSSISFTITVAITANNVTEVVIPSQAHLNGEGVSDAGINVTSVKPVVVYAHIYQSAVSGATLVLPVTTLGKEYYSVNYKQISNSANSYSYFFVVAVEDSTTVEITPSQTTLGGKPANQPFNVTLNKGQIYQVLGTVVNKQVPGNNNNFITVSSGTDLTGSKIRSISSNSSECKKIAVFSGSSKITIGCLPFALGATNPGSADNLFQQAYPTSSWGKSFVTVPLKERPFDIYRIIKSESDAIVQLNGITIPNGNFVNDLYYDFDSDVTNVITSNKPIQAVQYAVTQGKTSNCTGSTSGDLGDPEMIFLNPLEQTLTKITMFSTSNALIVKHFINIVIKDSGVASFKLDGVNQVSSFVQVPGIAGYSYAQLSVNVGTHTLTSNEGFNAIAYGFGNVDSYGYAAGANLFSSGIEPINITTSQIVETGCINTNYNFNIKLPYQPLNFFFDKDDGNGSYQSTPILKSTDIIDGETIYTYQFIENTSFADTGKYSFKVLAIKPTLDNCGSGDELTYEFTVNSLPIANFTEPDSLCLNSMISFTDSSTTLNGSTISAYLWDFNGEGTSGVKNPSFSFNAPGNKDIKLSVKSDEGCWSDIFTRQIYINQDPLPDFSFSAPACPNNEITFTDLSTSADGLIVSWLWDFGDATPNSTEQNPKHTYTTVQSYAVSLTIVTNLGCSKTILKDVNINPLPVIDFSTPDICLRDASVTFVNSTTIADNTEMQYLWNFGDPSSGALNISTDKDGFHTYSRAENYTITLKVISLITGCETILTKPFTVNGSSPEPAFSVLNENMLCSDQPVIFLDSASVDFGEITKIEWYFDYENKQTPDITDTDPASRSDPARQYTWTYPQFQSPISKNYKVRMVAYSGLTCVEEIDRVIILKAVPDIIFDSIPAICQEVLPFRINQAKENSGFAGREIFTGRGISSDGIFSPSIAGPGIHNINYKFIAENGCEQELNQNIIVYPSPEVDAGADQTILIGGQIQLNSVTSGDILSYRWTPATGLSRTDITNPIAFPTDSITYTLEVITTNGCNKIDRIFVNVLQKPIIPNTFTPNNDNINDKWEIKYLDSYNQVSVNVFNRYGKIVYRTNSYTEPWDGNLKGEELPTGVYYYIITANNNTLKYTGSVTIIR